MNDALDTTVFAADVEEEEELVSGAPVEEELPEEEELEDDTEDEEDEVDDEDEEKEMDPLAEDEEKYENLFAD